MRCEVGGMPEDRWIVHFWMTLKAGSKLTSVVRSKAGGREQISWTCISLKYTVDRNAEEPLGPQFLDNAEENEVNQRRQR